MRFDHPHDINCITIPESEESSQRMGKAVIALNKCWNHIEHLEGTWSCKYSDKAYWFSFSTTEDIDSKTAELLRLIAHFVAVNAGFAPVSMWPYEE